MLDDLLFLSLMMFGLFAVLSVRARMMHKAARDKTLRYIRNSAATVKWFFLRAKWTVQAGCYDLWGHVRHSPRVSPRLYLPAGPVPDRFPAFLEALAQHPAYGESVQKRLARLIRRQGINHRRTFEIRYLYGNPKLIAYRAFDCLVEADPVMLSDLVHYLESEGLRRNCFLLITGVSCTGKTALVWRLNEILEQGEPTPYLEGSYNRANPLQLLHLIHDFATSRFAEKPHSIAVAEILEELGFDRRIDLENKKFVALCQEAKVPPTLNGIAGITDRVLLTQTLFALLNLSRDAMCAAPCPTAWEKRMILQDLHLPQDARISSYQHSREEDIGFAQMSQPGTLHSCTSQFGRSNLAWLGRCGMDDRRAEDWSTEGHVSQRGILMVDEGLRCPAEFWRQLLDLNEGYLALACGEQIRWQGLLIVLSPVRDYDVFRNNSASAVVVDYAYQLRPGRCLEIRRLEELLEAIWDKRALRVPEDQRVHFHEMLDPLVIPYLARLAAVSEVDLPAERGLDRLDPCHSLASPALSLIPRHREGGISPRLLVRLMEDFAATVVEKCHGFPAREVQPLTVDKIQDKLSNFMRTKADELRLSLAAEAVDRWALEAHPVIATTAVVQKWWRKKHLLWANLVERYRKVS